MSVWCEKCQKTTFNEKKCDHCGQNPKKEVKTYQVPKNNGARKTKGKFLIPCDICGEKIAVKATSCPYCGDTKSKNLFWKIVKIIGIVIAIMFILEVIVTTIGISIIGNSFNNINKQNEKMIKDINKQSQEMLRKQNERMKNIFKK